MIWADIIPDAFEKEIGPEILFILGFIVTVGGFLGLVWRKVVKPIHDKIELIDDIKDAITPTNGDRRTISDRVDALKHGQETQGQRLEELEQTVHAHDRRDSRDFRALAKWTQNFKEFDPVELSLDEED